MREGAEINTLGGAWREFSSKRAPWIIAAGIVLALAARIAIGGVSWRDAAAAAFMLVVYPFGEWAIHVHLLHLKPFKWRGRRVDLVSARAHRQHHESPHGLALINFAPMEVLAIMLLAVPLTVGIGAGLGALLPGPLPFAPLVTMAAT